MDCRPQKFSIKIDGTLSYANPLSSTASNERKLSDQPDDTNEPQIHAMYIIPADGVDEHFDENGRIATSVTASMRWLASAMQGKTYRMDTQNNQLDITFFKLDLTDQQVKDAADAAGSGGDPLEIIAEKLRAAGFNKTNKTYLVYYGGSSNLACGTGGGIAVLFLKANNITGGGDCTLIKLTESEDRLGYWEVAALHELIHSWRLVQWCAPNYEAGHVKDNEKDVMYYGIPGSSDLDPVLDYNNDDYFRHSNNNCLDLDDSPYLMNVPIPPTRAPSLNPTVSPAPTGANNPSPTPTTNPTPTTTPNGTKISVAISLPGIGPDALSGDNSAPLGSKNGEVELINLTDQITTNHTVKLPFDVNSSSFTANIDAVKAGNYNIRVRTDNSLWTDLGFIRVEESKINKTPTTRLVSGDINSNNIVDLADYNILISCYGAGACDKKSQADLNIDGQVDEKDLNIFYSGLSNRQGD